MFILKPKEGFPPLRSTPRGGISGVAKLSFITTLECSPLGDRLSVSSRTCSRVELGKLRLDSAFFKARKRTRSKLPNRNQEIFDIDPILVLVENRSATKDLPLDKIQKKTLVLLTIATM